MDWRASSISEIVKIQGGQQITEQVVRGMEREQKLLSTAFDNKSSHTKQSEFYEFEGTLLKCFKFLFLFLNICVSAMRKLWHFLGIPSRMLKELLSFDFFQCTFLQNTPHRVTYIYKKKHINKLTRFPPRLREILKN